MTTTIEETAPDAVELTEFEQIDVQKVSGVAQGANGFPHLMLKGIPAADAEPEQADAEKAVVNGKVDQKPDIALGEKICTLLGQAMGNESQEVAAGHHGEAGDVHMLAQAHDLVRSWMNGEKTHPDGLKAAAEEDDMEKAKLTTAERDKLPDSAFALPGRHYPIHDENHAHAALSEVAQHGTPEEKAKVRAAVRRRYPDIKVDGDDSKSSKSAALAEGETTVEDVTQGNDDLAKAVEAAVTKALESHKAEIATLRDKLAKVMATPIPGGLVLSANARPAGVPQVNSELAAKADVMRRKADEAINPADAAGYRQYARQLDEQAKAAITD